MVDINQIERNVNDSTTTSSDNSQNALAAAMMQYWTGWSQGMYTFTQAAQPPSLVVVEDESKAQATSDATNCSSSNGESDQAVPVTEASKSKRKKARHSNGASKKRQRRHRPYRPDGFENWFVRGGPPIHIRDPQARAWVEERRELILSNEQPLPGGGPVKRYFWREQNEAKLRQMLANGDFPDDFGLDDVGKRVIATTIARFCRKAGLLWSDVLRRWRYTNEPTLHRLLLAKGPDVAAKANIFAGHHKAIDDSVLAPAPEGRKIRRVPVMVTRESSLEGPYDESMDRRMAESLIVADRFMFPYPPNTFEEDFIVTSQRLSRKGTDPVARTIGPQTERGDRELNQDLEKLRANWPNDHVKLFVIFRGPDAFTAAEAYFRTWVDRFIDPAGVFQYEIELYVYQGDVGNANVINDNFFNNHMAWSGVMNGSFSNAPIPVPATGQPGSLAFNELFALSTLLGQEMQDSLGRQNVNWVDNHGRNDI